MNREEMLKTITESKQRWDFIVIGGGATGVGTALEAASRGYRTVLLEQNDFSAGTSSRSTKLIHGGVRYLQQGNISLVLEALKERGLLRRNAPHLVHNLPFIVPTYDWWEGPFYGIGLKLYDVLAGKEGFGASKILSTEETLKEIPTVETDGLRGGVIYHDGQFDDSRLVINLAQTAAEQGAKVINYMKVARLLKKHDCISGVVVYDVENDKEYTLKSRAVINATGVFSDQIRQMDDPEVPSIIQPSQGVHIVLDRSFLPGKTAIMVPHTDDGRVLFAIPWHDKVIVGTTDTPVDEVVLEPIPLKEEIEFLLTHAAKYLIRDPSPEDVLSTFAGLRPLVSGTKNLETATISREHTISISRSGLVTIAGGKWTTYRKMAEETIDHAVTVAQLDHQPSVSRTLQIHGYHNHADSFGTLSDYGSDAIEIQNMIKQDPTLGERLPNSSILKAEVIWAVRNEMARTVEDFCARRRRLLILDARASLEIAPTVAQWMAVELKKGKDWERHQIECYQKTVQGYFIH